MRLAFHGGENGSSCWRGSGAEEVEFTPAAAVTDGDNDVGILDGLVLSSEARDERHKVSGGRVSEDEAEGKVVGKQFEIDLGSASLAHEAGSAGSALL